MNYLNILDSISDRSKVYFLPVDSTGIVSYENAFLTFHLTDLEGNKVTDIPGNYDSKGVYFDPINLIGLSVGKVYGLYLESRTRTERNYFPGQEVLYLILTTDAKLSILKDISADYFKNLDNGNSNIPFNSVQVVTLGEDKQAYSRIINNTLLIGIPKGKTGPVGPKGDTGEQRPVGARGLDGTNGREGISYIPLKSDYLPKIYNFFVAFKAIIGLGYQVSGLASIDNGIVDSLQNGQVCGISYGNSNDYLGLSLINLKTDNTDWRDTNANCSISPAQNIKVTLKLGVTNHDWYYFDLSNLGPQKLNVGADGVVNISSLRYYRFILGVPKK